MGCPIRGVILDPIVAMEMGIQGQVICSLLCLIRHFKMVLFAIMQCFKAFTLLHAYLFMHNIISQCRFCWKKRGVGGLELTVSLLFDTEVGCGCFYLTILSNHTMTFHVFHAQCNCFILFFWRIGGKGGITG